MILRKPTSVSKTIRIPSNLLGVLETDAGDKGMSLNSLITSILAKYADWDRYAGPDRFGEVLQSILRGLFDAIDDEVILRLARKVSQEQLRDSLLTRPEGFTFEGLVEGNRRNALYGRIIGFDHEQNDNHHTLRFRHSLGYKFNIFLREYTIESLRQVARVVPECDFGENSLVFRFDIPNTLRERPIRLFQKV